MEEKNCEINNVADFVEIVQEWNNKFASEGLGNPPIWYRGQGDADWKQTPGVLRPPFAKMISEAALIKKGEEATHALNRERTLTAQFFRAGASLFPPGCGIVEKYFLAQHHGLPTRLLDWTLSPLAALYFCVSSSADKDGTVAILNPRSIANDENVESELNGRNGIVEDSHSVVRKLISYICAVEECKQIKDGLQSMILPIQPDLVAGRIYQQMSTFTLHMPESKTLEDSVPSGWFEQYLVPQSKKAEVRLMLRRLGVTAATLFHDLDHVATEIKSSYGLT